MPVLRRTCGKRTHANMSAERPKQERIVAVGGKKFDVEKGYFRKEKKIV